MKYCSLPNFAVDEGIPMGIQGSLRGLRRDFPVCSRSAEYPVPVGIQGSLRGLRRDFPVCSRSTEYPVPVTVIHSGAEWFSSVAPPPPLFL